MQAILPGRPQAQLQAVSTGSWEGQTVVAYISGTALIICNGPDSLLQTIYHDEVSSTDGLVAVSYDHRSAKIATASSDTVYIYVLREEIKGQLRWFPDMTFEVNGQEKKQEKGRDNKIRTLSWGTDDELLVASDKLSLLSTQDHSTRWTKPLPSPVGHAVFSPSAALLATTSQYDCLVKVWRRLSFESATFDYAYLKHPQAVTHVEWRSCPAEEDVLYTLCLDGRLRVWKTGPQRQKDVLTMYAELDLFTAVHPKTPSHRRFAFLIPSEIFSQAVEHAVNTHTLPAERHAIEYLKEMAAREPDMVVVTDDQGHMSAWGLENVGCKRRASLVEPGQFFHAAHAEDLVFDFPKHVDPFEDNARIINFPLARQPGDIALLVHYFDGRIQWWQGSVHHVFDPSPRKQRMRNLANWTGHSSSIKKLIRTANGSAVISRTDTDEGVVWKHHGRHLVRKSKTKLEKHIHRTALLQHGDFIVLLHHDSITLWDARVPNANEIARCSYNIAGKPLCLLLLPTPEDAPHLYHLATVTSDMHGIVWELDLHDPKPSMVQFCTFQLDPIENMSYFLPVDPAGSSPVVSGFLDTFAQDVAVSWTSTGILQTWTAKIDRQKKSVDWLTISTTETGIQNPSLGSGTSIRKAALVDKSRSTLTIWDTKSGRLDYQETFANQTIHDLDWASTPDNQSILSVGFPHAVYVYTQLRYDYVTERPSWSRIKEVSTRHLSPHPIGDSVWLSSGNLVIGAGNQLYLVDSNIDPHKDLSPELQVATPHKSSNRIHNVVRRLNGPLPVFHPQFISQCILAGKMDIVHRVLLNLQGTLKFYTEGDDLDSFQGLTVDNFMSSTEQTSNSSRDMHKSYNAIDTDQDSTTVNEDVATSIVSLLTQKSIPQLSSTEQFSLADIVECVGILEQHRRSIDDNAARFLVFWREAIVRAKQSAGSSPQSIGVTWREMLWAYHSSSQDILVDLITRQHKGKLEWSHARDTGMFVWLSDREALLQQFEVVARNAYTSTDLRDPVNCSLYYLALRKKAVLVGLWRMATWSREQAATMRLLKNDFSDQRWRTAANKNAYALMGKRRFEYAAAFFLLADNLDSAVSVLSNQLGDVQLAIAVARVYGGDECPTLRNFLTNKALPAAAEAGNRWQATWCYWMLKERSLAVRCLVNPLHSLLNPPAAPPESLSAKSFLNDDPALVVLYKQLREKSLQTLKGAMMISGKEEWQFITKTATLLLRMGCDVIALDLVRNWEFLQQQPPVRSADTEEQETVGDLPANSNRMSAEIEVDPRKLLRRRSSLVVADLPDARPKLEPRTPSMLDGWGDPFSQAKSQAKAAPSALDQWTMPERPKEEAKQPASMLDEFVAPATKTKAPPSMLDEWSAPTQSKKSNSKAAPSMLDDWAAPAPQKKVDTPKAAPSMLDAYAAPPSKPKAAPPKAAPSMLEEWSAPPPPAKPAPQKAPPSMLDEYTAPALKPKAAPSMLDEWSAPAPTKKPDPPKAAPSMLDEWTASPVQPKPKTTKPAPSMLDGWAEPASRKKPDPPKAVPSMLDEYTTPAPQKESEAPKAVPSMLDEYTAPAPQSKASSPMLDEWSSAPQSRPTTLKKRPSMLDGWVSPFPKAAAVKEANGDDEKIATDTEDARNGTKKDGQATEEKNGKVEDRRVEDSKATEYNDGNATDEKKSKDDGKDEYRDEKNEKESKKEVPAALKGRKQPPPEAFKEPDPNSLLDAFGF